MREFAYAVTPLDGQYRQRHYQGYLTHDEKFMQTTSWVTSLYDLVLCMEQGQREIETSRKVSKIEADSIFGLMDTYRKGYVTGGQFANWVSANCGFHLSESDLCLAVRALDGANGSRICRDRFLAAVSCPPDEDEVAAQKAAEQKAA